MCVSACVCGVSAAWLPEKRHSTCWLGHPLSLPYGYCKCAQRPAEALGSGFWLLDQSEGDTREGHSCDTIALCPHRCSELLALCERHAGTPASFTEWATGSDITDALYVRLSFPYHVTYAVLTTVCTTTKTTYWILEYRTEWSWTVNRMYICPLPCWHAK